MATATVNFTLFASSPMFNFAPTISAGVGSATTGWQYNQSGESGLYFTTLPGSSLELLFFGTGIQLEGSAGCPFSVSIDGNVTEQSLASGLIFSKTGLEQASHNLNLTVGSGAGPNAEVIFTSAIVTDEYPVGQVPVEATYAGMNSALGFFGPWSQFSNGTAHTDYPGASVSVNFTGPAILVTGPSESFGQYYVAVDDEPDILVSTDAFGPSQTQLFFQSGLDPNQQHQVTITNVGGSSFAFNSIEVWESTFPSSTPTPVPSSASSGHSDVVKIVVPIVAVVAALLILVAALLIRKRRQRRRTATLKGPFAMRLSRAFGKRGVNALTLDNLRPKTEQPADGVFPVSFDVGNEQKA
ncbi:hypothetical protein OBBRIDRAFT_798476 [Obba rivulosa]|uniref:Uncharacterized protein n=1 Tax=Obba rivulosa TaxID=1052685 RepID=A0A8E2ATS2_9APHY|nr:hypothetical protein OBBRIDRAFT_798476 [Obba rivulosa]